MVFEWPKRAGVFLAAVSVFLSLVFLTMPTYTLPMLKPVRGGSEEKERKRYI
jgi:hypothetical protein